jgi:hypothetical protein
VKLRSSRLKALKVTDERRRIVEYALKPAQDRRSSLARLIGEAGGSSQCELPCARHGESGGNVSVARAFTRLRVGPGAASNDGEKRFFLKGLVYSLR